MHQRNRGSDAERSQIAAEAARIMAEEGVDDHLLARNRVLRRHPGNPHLPDRAEIDAALTDYLQLFHGERHRARLRGLRLLALRVMEELADLRPALTGSVLGGNAVAGSRIELHLTGHQAEEVAISLMNRGIPYRNGQRHILFGRNHPAELPTVTIEREGTEIELVIFEADGPRQPPRDPVTGGAMRRATVAALRRLIESENEPAGEEPSPAGDELPRQRRSSET